MGKSWGNLVTERRIERGRFRDTRVNRPYQKREGTSKGRGGGKKGEKGEKGYLRSCHSPSGLKFLKVEARKTSLGWDRRRGGVCLKSWKGCGPIQREVSRVCKWWDRGKEGGEVLGTMVKVDNKKESLSEKGVKQTFSTTKGGGEQAKGEKRADRGWESQIFKESGVTGKGQRLYQREQKKRRRGRIRHAKRSPGKSNG